MWAGALIRMIGGWLPKRIVFGNLEGEVRRGRVGKEKEWTDCVQSDIRAFGITGDWKAAALKAEVWVETRTEGLFIFSPDEQCGEYAARLFILFFFPCSADHERDWSPCVCVFFFFPFILDIKFVGRTSRGHTGGRSHRISHPPSFCGACLNFSREKNSAIPFPRRP